ncbi:ankyrin repeat domain-containing protein [Streptomyces sp. NPDC048606]|uniref:ankyrin repeat domain-containing protein n=1 Tax=Streptomyces sp. NPDC048606 TaxID=3154726 RepID=UPI00343D9106
MTRRPAPPGTPSSEELGSVRRVRRYAVPGWMIEAAGAHREAGDWRAACAAAAVDVALEPAALAARHGRAVADAVLEDLRHLAPDLLRWHLPRVLGGRTTLVPDQRILLAHYGPDGGPGRPGRGVPSLYVRTYGMVDGPQRLRLECGPFVPVPDANPYARVTTVDWSTARHLWDVRHAPDLRTRAAGGGADRLPFFAPDGTPLPADALATGDPGPGDPAARTEWIAVLQSRAGSRAHLVEAFAAAGIEADLDKPADEWRSYGVVHLEDALASGRVDLSRLAHEARLLAAAGLGDRFRLAPDWRDGLLVEVTGPGAGDTVRARTAGSEELRALAPLPEHAWRPLPDLQLVRAGRLAPTELHPLVAASLFPGSGPATGPAGPTAPRPVRVRCLGVWHEVRARADGLAIPHTDEERRRERALRAFGGVVAGCFAAERAWTSGEGRLPRALREERQDLFERAQHGDAPGVLALLDAGVDPRVRNGRGQGLLHVLYLLDHEELLPRLLGVGLGLEDHDRAGRTPLLSAVHHGGAPALVRALIDAGARVDVTDEEGLSLPQIARRYRRTDLAFLRELVEAGHPDIGSPDFDEYMDERDDEYRRENESDGYEPEPEEELWEEG